MKRFYFVLLGLLFLLNLSYAQFKYEHPIYVKNNTGTALTDVQVLIKFNTQIPIGLGWMQSDGKDIVFTSICGGISYLSHFVEAYLNTDSTKIWVKVPSIGANDSALIFINYGNPGATNISTLNVFDGPNSAHDSVSVSSTNTVSNCQRGFRFTANQDVLVGYFGKKNPNATQRYVTLFDYNTQAILAQIQVDAGAAGIYNYNQLTTPIWLRAGTQYILEVYNGTGDMYYYGVSTQIGQAFTFGDMRYCNSCTQNTFPTSIVTGQHYGIPDLLYYTYQVVTPAPTARILNGADTLAPAAPTGVTATPGSGQATIKWLKNTEFDIAMYRVYKNTSNTPGTATLAGTVNHPDTTLIASGLANGTWYFWVQAVDGYCNPKTSAYSTVASCTVGGSTAIVNRSLLLPTPGVNTNYVSIPYNAGQNFGNSITIEAWVKLGGTTTANTILNKGAASFDYQLGIIGSTATPFFRGPSTQATSTYVIPAGVWTHVAVTSNGTQAVFYMNGVPQTIATAVTLGSTTNEMRIGRGNADPGSGKLDELRLWSVVRTPAEILANMCIKYIPNTTTGLKAKWHMDSTFVDSVSGFNGTGVGNVGFDTANNCMMTGMKNVQNEIPLNFQLYQNYPNPFNPSTTIKFSIPKNAYVEMNVYDVTGKMVATLVSDPYLAGTYQVNFNASNLASGIYFCSIIAGDFKDVKKMVLIK